MTPLISVCIPTFNRPSLLLKAVHSCLEQSYKNIEIVISDDSTNDDSEKAISEIKQADIVRYYRNIPPLKQALNVNQLFRLAFGEYLILLHDDDLLLPNAIQSMLNCFQDHPGLIACFGKQQIIDMQGTVLERETEALNKMYYRTDEYAGLQSLPIKSALLAQFPNNGYLVKSSAARDTGYRDLPEVGDICDYDFGLRLAFKSEKFYFLNQFTAAYRITDISISKDNNHSNLSYDLISSLKISNSLEKYRNERLCRHATPAINKWLQMNEKRKAFNIYASGVYTWRKKFSLVGIAQILLILMPHKATNWILNKRGIFL